MIEAGILVFAVFLISIIAMVKVFTVAVAAINDIQTAAAIERKYLLDRIQTGDAAEAGRLNAPEKPKKEVIPGKVNFGTAYGLQVDPKLTKEGIGYGVPEEG
jgi:hypothetical protein